MAIVRFKSFDRIRELLREAGVKSISIDPEDCIQHAIRVVSGQQEPLVGHDVSESIIPTEPKLSVFLSARPIRRAFQRAKKWRELRATS
jgi:hypothetical protein